MTDHQSPAAATGERTFTWHPNYRGRSAESVEQDLAEQLVRDQHAYELALSGADKSEHQALASVMELEKRWSTYSFDWAEMPAAELARRIVAFELERDRREEMIPYDQYRDEAAPAQATPDAGWREAMSDEQRRRVARLGAGVVMIVVALGIIIILSMVF